MFTIGELEHELPSPDFRADRRDQDAGLFPQLADGGLLECLTDFDGAARRSPIILSREGAA
jgi:hypothetical protein